MALLRPLRRRDHAVSPVIAVILMVAITVVLAATVYVWVSGFGQSGAQAKSASFSATSSGSATSFTLVSASTGLRWNDVKITVDGATTYGILVSAAGCSSYINSAAWDGGTQLSSTACTAAPGDVIKFGVASLPSGTVHMNIVDKPSNTVVSTPTLPTLAAVGAGGADLTCPTSTTVSFGGLALYSKSAAAIAANSAAIQTSDVARTGTAITSVTHSLGGTSMTLSLAGATGNTVSFGAGKVYDLGGTEATDTCNSP